MLMFLEMDVQAKDLCRMIIHDSFSSVMRQFAPFLISLRRSYVFWMIYAREPSRTHQPPKLTISSLDCKTNTYIL